MHEKNFAFLILPCVLSGAIFAQVTFGGDVFQFLEDKPCLSSSPRETLINLTLIAFPNVLDLFNNPVGY
jgi:hypothetical protein